MKLAREWVVSKNRFKKMELSQTEYRILKVAEDDRAGREVGIHYGGIHSLDPDMTSLASDYPAIIKELDEHGIIEPYGHPYRFILTEKGRLLLRIYELEND